MADEVRSQTDQDGDTPVFDLLADMTAASLDRATLEPAELMLVRLAALVALDAPPLSYLANLSVAAGVGITSEEVEGVLTAVAPIVGTPRVVAAAGNIMRAMGIAVVVAEEAELASIAADDYGQGHSVENGASVAP